MHRTAAPDAPPSQGSDPGQAWGEARSSRPVRRAAAPAQTSRSNGSVSGDGDAARAAWLFIRRMWCRRHSTSYSTTPVRRGRGVADDDLLALDDHDAVDDAGVVRRLAPAPAQRLHLEQLHPVGELDEPPAAREELGAEVGGDPEGVDVDADLVDDPRELLDLRRGVELRLVTDEVVDPRAGGEPLDDHVPEVEAVADLDGGRRQARAARRAPTPPSGRAW